MLLINAMIKYIMGAAAVGLLLFIPAGTLKYSGAWIFIALLFVPMLVLGIILYIKSPDLLKKRLSVKETQSTQKAVVAVSGLCFTAGLVVAGLDFRSGWSAMPQWLRTAACIVLFVSYALYAEVMRENAYLSRTVEVQKNQKVIDTGLYAVVRHPMYAVTLWMFFSVPVVLDSLWSLLCFLPYIAVIVVRIINEEKLLKANLPGYTEYIKRVKYRLVPFVW